MFYLRSLTLLAICICICSCADAPQSGLRSANSTSPSVSQTRIKVVSSEGRFSNISPADVDTNFNAVNEILNTNDGVAMNGDGDFSCPIQIVREGDIRTLSSTIIPTVVKDEADFTKICGSMTGFIYIVDTIEWCGEGSPTYQDGSFKGCSDLEGNCMIVTRPEPGSLFTPELESVLWAHEYVHTVGEADSCILGCRPKHRDRLMHPVVAINHRKIGQNEYYAIMR